MYPPARTGRRSNGGPARLSGGMHEQPATADTVIIVLSMPAGKESCGTSQTDSFSPGSPINITVTLKEQPNAYHSVCFDTFSMKS